MRTNPTLPVFALGFLVSVLALSPALAATVSTTFTVTATVVSGCDATPSTQSFKNYAAATANAASTISVTCDRPTPYVVSLNSTVVPGESATLAKATGSGEQATGSSSAMPGGPQPSSSQHAINRARTIDAGTAAGAKSGSPQWRAVLDQAKAAEDLAPGASPDSIMVSITY
jgi:spore coat protein U-like protein